MKESYITLAKEAKAEIVEKRSRFIATVRPVEIEEDALAFLNQLRQDYWDATHNVYAYILEENQLTRYSDDGEPGGTAGMPVLDILRREKLSNLIVVVTRYFGGTLLGTGGLVHAYSKAAKAGIEAAGRVERLLCRQLFLDCDYHLWGSLQNDLSKQPSLLPGEPLYTQKVRLPLSLPLAEVDTFCARIVDRFHDQIEVTVGETLYCDRPLTL